MRDRSRTPRDRRTYAKVAATAMNGASSSAVTGISSMATRHVLTELCAAYALETGQQVHLTCVGGIDALHRVRDGDAFDFVVLAADAVERLAHVGRVHAWSIRDLACADIAIAVRAGATKPEIGSERAVREAVLAAPSIGYSTGPSGAYLVRLLERWKIGEAIESRLVQAPPGVPVATLVARGNVGLGFQQLSELLHAPGIDVVGLLPPAIRHTTVFTGAVCMAAHQPQAAAALLAFLASDEASAAKRRHGLEAAQAKR